MEVTLNSEKLKVKEAINNNPKDSYALKVYLESLEPTPKPVRSALGSRIEFYGKRRR